MPKIKKVQQKEEQQKKQPKKDLEQGPSTLSQKDNSDDTLKSADRIFNKMFSIEKEDVSEEERHSQNELVMTKRNIGQTNFVSKGKTNFISVFPTARNTKYNLEIIDKNGNVLKTIPNLRNTYKAKANLMAGNYMVKVVSEKGGRTPFFVRIE